MITIRKKRVLEEVDWKGRDDSGESGKKYRNQETDIEGQINQ